ncbi:VOC family protein [Flagellimonas marinaquae]|uniref:VOC family protein n=1 Tax=Flagellimonas marinaquae TaxID=254955 RepID=UPI000F8D5069|nr:VOC family protein [Allomuricauda aquimarina]
MKTPIDYIEFKSTDLGQTKNFYSEAFGWEFTDYGPSYVSFSEAGITGGFELSTEPIKNGALVVLYHGNLKTIKEKVIKSGGAISKEIFGFPGGKRFHFMDPSGNELAIWSEK